MDTKRTTGYSIRLEKVYLDDRGFRWRVSVEENDTDETISHTQLGLQSAYVTKGGAYRAAKRALKVRHYKKNPAVQYKQVQIKDKY